MSVYYYGGASELHSYGGIMNTFLTRSPILDLGVLSMAINKTSFKWNLDKFVSTSPISDINISKQIVSNENPIKIGP